MLTALVYVTLAHGLNPAMFELRERPGGLVEYLFRAPSDLGGVALSPRFPSWCRTHGQPRLTSDGMGESVRSALDCGAAGLSGQLVSIDGLEQREGLEVFVRLELLGGVSVLRVLNGTQPSLVVPTAGAPMATVRDYLALGVEHIMSGYDHLLFVLGMVLLVGSRRRLAIAVTAFTLAHSLTLSLATLGLVHLPSRASEAVIALSIVFLAAELTRHSGLEPTWTQRWPWAMAFGFGLLHGFGFAGALLELGLPERDVPLALLGFNLGVEVGQLICVLVALGVGAVARKLLPRSDTLRRPFAYAMGALAFFWVLERTIALMA